MKIIPITIQRAKDFITHYHRHHKPSHSWKFGVGIVDDSHCLVGVAMAGRPISRHFDDGYTLEVNRTCTDGTKNANSMLYGSVWRAAKAMGYRRLITYTQANESGISLKASGFIKVKELPARKSWKESSYACIETRDSIGSGGIARILWEIKITHEKIY